MEIRLLFLTLSLLVSFSTHAQDHMVLSGNGRPWLQFTGLENIFHKAIANDVLHELENRQKVISQISTKADVEYRISYVKKAFTEVVGEFPEKTPLNPRVLEVMERGFCTIEKLIFESRPGIYVTAAVFKPRVSPRKKLPAVLYLSGHSDIAFRSKTYQKTILNLVKKGFLVLAIDPIGQGERNEKVDRELPFDYTKPTIQHSFIGSQCLLAGSSFIKHMIWDGIRAVDYLESRSDVDMENVGATGRSGGGTQTAWLGIFEERLKAIVIENYITSFKRLTQSIGFQDAEQSVSYGILKGLDFADLILARAPKPTLIIATDADFFNIQGAFETYKEAKKHYGLLGFEGNIGWQTDVAHHASTVKNRERLYQFFLKNLSSNQQDVFDEVIDPIPLDSLMLLDDGWKQKMFAKTIYDVNRQEYLEQKTSKTARKEEIDSAYLKNMLGIRWNEGEFVKTTEIHTERYAIEKYFIDHDAYPLPFVVIKPLTNDLKKLLVYYSPKGKEAMKNEALLKLVDDGYSLLLTDLLGIGELGKGNYGGSSTALNRGGVPPNSWFMGNQTRHSILGSWIADMKKVQDFVAHRFHNHKTYVWASDFLTVPALHLPYFSEQHQCLGLYGLLYSWESLITNKFYDPKWLPTSIPGITFQYDIQDLLERNETDALRIFNLVGANAEVLTLEELEQNTNERFYSYYSLKTAGSIDKEQYEIDALKKFLVHEE